MRSIITFIMAILAATVSAMAQQTADDRIVAIVSDDPVVDVIMPAPSSAQPDTTYKSALERPSLRVKVPSIYELPYSMKTNVPNWNHLWVNTGVYAGAFVGTLLVLECLPEDATTWNRAALQKDPPQVRWFRNVFKRGPEWDHDNPIFNFVLHPYAGAVYFMSARSSGFNFYRSLLYSACISTIGWEFGIEACMERPSIQDIFITPLAGSALGELFYRAKRHIVANDYRLLGSPVLGNIAAFFLDPVNEVLGYFGNNPARHMYKGYNGGITSSFMPSVGRGSVGFSFACTF